MNWIINFLLNQNQSNQEGLDSHTSAQWLDYNIINKKNEINFLLIRGN